MTTTSIPAPAANPDARGNRQQGRTAFQSGLRDKESVLRSHLRWNRGTAGDHHFCEGYKEAAAKAGEPIGEALDYLVVWRGALPLSDQVRILEIVCEEQIRVYGRAAAQWQLDRARHALAHGAQPKAD
jgi:hypothetical protein